MNVAFFLIPKKDVVFVDADSTMRQAMEKMEYHRYAAVPIVDKEGKYVGTLTEGDLLWKIKNTPTIRFHDTHKIRLKDIELYRYYEPISINAEMEDILTRIIDQNFIPVIDDQGVFIGIIRRREVIDYCAKQLFNRSSIA